MSQTRYQILGTIGVGASSRVDKAHDTLIDRTVVLKTFATGFGSLELQKQFLREAQILGRLSHPNIICIYDLGTNDDGSAYLVTEYVPGKTLDAVLSEKGPVPLVRAGVWAGDLASALSRAHKAGVIHGDVKPANIFVTDDGQIKLGDFGIARFATQVSGAASLVGTPAYLSPEQIKGEPQDHRSDIFSVGIVLYQLTTGVRPFDGSSVAAVCAQIVAKQPPAPSHHNPALPPEFDRIVMRCLAKNPGDRYGSGESLAASLYPFARSQQQPPPHRLDFSFFRSWFNRPLRPADKWIYGGAVVAALLAIPVVHRSFPNHHRPAVANIAAAPLAVTTMAVPQKSSLDFASPAGEEAAPSTAAARKAQPPAQIPRPKRSASHVDAANSTRAKSAEPKILNTSSAGISASVPEAVSKTSLPALRATAEPRVSAAAASLGIEISSAIEGATLAIFVDQQLAATSPLSVTRPGQTLHLDRRFPPGAHEFRIALYRQDKTLQIEKQALAELQTGTPNLLAIRVVRRSKMLVKHDAGLDILWPSASLSPNFGSPNAAPKSGAPDTPAAKGSAPLVATSVR
ncbi:MAG TPA: protein kinase [Candidatus Acidoferrum sp.]|nr:protein kinase [Candidatus Acidoferrum sp.]